MKKGILYWITGLSGAGKTTVGNALYYELREKNPSVVILDGDILKSLVGDSLGYSREDREKRAYHYSNMCKILTDQGISVVICTIAMFDSVRAWNRKNIERYVEVYLKVDKDILIKRDRKGLYSRHQAGAVTDVAGLDVEVEFPKTPDITIENDGSRSVSDCVGEILAFQVKEKDSFSRDVPYWNNYYKQDLKEIQQPSDFARAVLPYLKQGKSLLDLGCGNGRDSIFFAQQDLKVTGIDASKEAIGRLSKYHGDVGTFVCDDFVTSKALYQIQYDYFYSRWTMHAISERQEDELLCQIAGAIKEGGTFFVEARSVRDELYGRGEKVGENAFLYNNHYRRFMEKERFSEKLEGLGFHIISMEEGTGFSKTPESDPVLVRVIASR